MQDEICLVLLLQVSQILSMNHSKGAFYTTVIFLFRRNTSARRFVCFLKGNILVRNASSRQQPTEQTWSRGVSFMLILVM